MFKFKTFLRSLFFLILSFLISGALVAVSSTGNQVQTVQALNNGLAQVPYMGWNSWYAYGENINDTKIRQAADAIVSNGLNTLGYTYVGIDGGWWTTGGGGGRDANGNIIPNPTFPNMGALTAYIHSKGLKAGTYTDTGSSGCGTAFGSYGHQQQDVNQFAAWGFDLLKVDHCGGNPQTGNTASEYAYWRDVIANNSSQRSIVYNICEWGVNTPWVWGPATGNSWRTGGDISFDSGHTNPFFRVSWASVLGNFDANNHPSSAGPGGWNDPDYLLIGGFGLTATEEQSYFSMWAIQAAPLILATDVTNMTQATKNTIMNNEVIAIDQDPLGKQGTLVREDTPGLQVWSKTLSGTGVRAALLLNRNASATNMTVNWTDLGLQAGNATVRNLWTKTNLGTLSNGYTVNVPSHGVVMLKVTGTEPPPALTIPQSQMSATATSYHVGYEPSKALDGNSTSMWHTEWAPLAALPQSITLNLGGSYNINKLRYLPRDGTDGYANGRITSYNIYVSTNGTNFGSPVASGTWLNNAVEKSASFPAVTASYIRLQAVQGVSGFASAAEINVEYQTLTPIPQSQMSATATSYHVGHEPSKALDGNVTTMWHAEWSPLAPLPQSITLNLGGSYTIKRLRYLPRNGLDGYTNGRITSYNIYVSTNGTTFGSPIASGTWANDALEKSATFTAVTASYIRLEAVQGVNGFASAAEINVDR
jgi:hypothetical protein